jgi:hypothetical protein
MLINEKTGGKKSRDTVLLTYCLKETEARDFLTLFVNEAYFEAFGIS